MKRYCLALDLIDDATLINEYERYHQSVWPEILRSIHDAGIQSMEIYRAGNRMFMIMETAPDFSFAAKAELDLSNPRVREWEQLMWKYQQAIPAALPGEKWTLMRKIFETRQ